MNVIRRCPCLLLSIIVLSLAGCDGEDSDSAPTPGKSGNGGAPSAEIVPLTTPQAAFEALKADYQLNNFGKFCGHLTPETQETLAGTLVAFSRFFQELPRSDIPTEREREDAVAAELQKVLEKHGVTDETLPEVQVDDSVTDAEKLRELRKLAGPIRDHCAFVADVLDVLHKYVPDARLIGPDARIEDVKVEGDAATAVFIQLRGDEEMRDRIAFRKIGGEWKISEMPALLSSALLD